MSNMSDKLSASVRKARERGGEQGGTEQIETTTSTAQPKQPANRARKPRPAGAKRSTVKRTASAPRNVAGNSTPESSHDELFPTRVWPD